MKFKIFILTGDKQSGKSTSLKEWVIKQPNVSGFITLDGQDAQRHIYDLKTGVSTPYATKCYVPNAIPIGKWFLFNDGLRIGIDIINNFEMTTRGILVIDEIGILELKGQGYANGFHALLERIRDNDSHLTLIIVVRIELVDQVITYFDLKNSKIIGKEELISLTL